MAPTTALATNSSGLGEDVDSCILSLQISIISSCKKLDESDIIDLVDKSTVRKTQDEAKLYYMTTSFMQLPFCAV